MLLQSLAFFDNMFIDRVTIKVRAGDGGDGSNAVRRLRKRHKKIYHGGAGGKGGAVILLTDEHLISLLDIDTQRVFSAEAGQRGTSNRRRGRSGTDLIIKIPVGSVVWDDERGLLLRDLASLGERLVVVRGGRAGGANANNHPAEKGGRGERRRLRIELKLIADAGLIGYPNSGKSTLLTTLTRARVRIAAHPFSTLEPKLGILEDPETFERVVLCDIPGLIEGAHTGKGLGNEFLRHIERTRVLIHLIEMQDVAGLSPWERYRKINAELAGYHSKLTQKKQIVVATKMDLAGAQPLFKRFSEQVDRVVIPISAKNDEGLHELRATIMKTMYVYSNGVMP